MGDVVQIIRVNLEEQDSGLFCASSPDLPGFVLVNRDVAKIKAVRRHLEVGEPHTHIQRVRGLSQQHRMPTTLGGLLFFPRGIAERILAMLAGAVSTLVVAAVVLLLFWLRSGS